MEPKDVSDVQRAFPAGIIKSGLLPAWDQIPEEFRQGWFNDGSIWHALFARLFYGPRNDTEKACDLVLTPKPGIDPMKAWRHLDTCMRSFEPKHEHKTAGVAWLMSEWFESYAWVPATGDKAEVRFEDAP